MMFYNYLVIYKFSEILIAYITILNSPNQYVDIFELTAINKQLLNFYYAVQLTKTFPHLYVFACKLLSIPVSDVESERSCSILSNLERPNLNSDIKEAFLRKCN